VTIKRRYVFDEKMMMMMMKIYYWYCFVTTISAYTDLQFTNSVTLDYDYYYAVASRPTVGRLVQFRFLW